jgi:RimJ/RimL family protein N-acetyltransferase
MIALRRLVVGDEEALERFLRPRTETSMFLRSNVRAAGLVDRGEPLQGTYLACFEGDEVVAVAAQAWNGMVLVQAPPELLPDVVRAAVLAGGRPVRGISGAWDQCVAARAALGLEGAKEIKVDREELFSLSLDALVVPGSLSRGEIRVRAPRMEELDLLGRWRAAYSVETLGLPDAPTLHESTRADIERICRHGDGFVAERVAGEGQASWPESEGLVAFSAFNAHLPDVVQIGGVWTPPALRGRGFARAVVGGSLVLARAQGVSRAILFTSKDNQPARRAYLALGFQVIGDYALMLFAS